MKRYFFSGLALVFPTAMTLVIVMFAMNLLTRPFEGFTGEFLGDTLFWKWMGKGLIIFVLFLATLLFGFLTRIYFTRYFIQRLDALMHKIPVFNTIYHATQDVVKTVFGHEKMQFTQVVLVPFHENEYRCIGFLTGENGEQKRGLHSVFVPASPNPLMGFLLLYPKEDIQYLEMSVEDALKMIISCGVVLGKGLA